MTSPIVAPPAVLGVQRPRIWTCPPAESSAGQEAIELAELAGLYLDPWEKFVLDRALGERADGKWSAFEVGLEVPRQNGKGAILEARELAGLFLFGEELLTHTAHEFPTSLEAFNRLAIRIESTPDLDRRVDRIIRSHGDEGIRLKGGQRIHFRTRTKGGGRGFSGDYVGLDEAMILPEAALGALLPTLSARPNPQVWYTGSPVDQAIHQHGVVFARVRERGIKGDDPRLAYFEFSLPYDSPDDVPDDVAADPEAWAQTNPALGIRISTDYIAGERRAMAARTFAVERLGVGDWPRTDKAPQMISIETWLARTDLSSAIASGVGLAFDVSPDQSRSSISAAGRRRDGLEHMETIENDVGTDWVVDRLVELDTEHNPVAICCDAAGPAGSLLPELANRGLDVTPVSAREYGQACGLFYRDLDNGRLHHLGTPEMSSAIQGAAQRALGDAWAWDRKSSGVDITPLVSGTLALWASSTAKKRKTKAGIEF